MDLDDDRPDHSTWAKRAASIIERYASVDALAERTGIPAKLWAQWAGGEGEPSAEQLKLVLAKTDYDGTWLLCGKPPVRRPDAIARAVMSIYRQMREDPELASADPEEIMQMATTLWSLEVARVIERTESIASHEEH